MFCNFLERWAYFGVTRRLTRLQNMYNVLKYRITWWNYDTVSIFGNWNASGNYVNLIICSAETNINRYADNNQTLKFDEKKVNTGVSYLWFYKHRQWLFLNYPRGNSWAWWTVATLNSPVPSLWNHVLVPFRRVTPFYDKLIRYNNSGWLTRLR